MRATSLVLSVLVGISFFLGSSPAHAAGLSSDGQDAAEGERIVLRAQNSHTLTMLRLRRWKENLEGRLRTVDKEISLDRFLLVQLQRMYTPRISPSYYATYGEVCSKLRTAQSMRGKLRFLLDLATRKIERESGFCAMETLN